MTALLRTGQIADLLYRAGAAPWDIGECQPVVRQLIAHGVIRGSVLDPGCGTGAHAIEYARAGHPVVGIDSALAAIARARRNARDAGVTAHFHLGDIIDKLEGYENRFDTVVDAKLYDNLETTAARELYAAALHRATKPGAKLVMYGFGPGHVNGVHNHELEEPDFKTVLPAHGFTITYVGPATYQLNNRSAEPLCGNCPPRLPTGRIHIPVTEVHAVRG